MADPSFAKLLGEIQGGKEGEAEPPKPPALTPEMMAKLPEMMTALAPLVGRGGHGGHGASGGHGGEGKTPSEAEKRKKLLAALRPYLNENRRGAVDSILKVTEMTDLLEGLKPKS